MWRRVFAAGVVGAFISACSSGDGGGSDGAARGPAPERYDAAADFVAALDAGDVTCAAFEDDAPSPGTFGIPEGVSAGTCEISSTLEIDLYATNADAREAVTGTLDLLACNDDAPDYDILSGANWTALGSPDDIDTVRGVVGGDVTTLCD
jgi:hypothetical protein